LFRGGFFRNPFGAIFRHANFAQRFRDVDFIQQGENITMKIIKLIGVKTGHKNNCSMVSI